MSVVPKQERRRRQLLDEGEDVGAETPIVVTRSSTCESEDESPSIENESTVGDSADQEDETEEGSETETEDGSETEEETGSETEGYTDEEGLEEERQSGDGEEQPDKDKPDDDEDKKNPAYVPRKGAFYEHDFRHGVEAPEGEAIEEVKPKKKLWQDEGKWNHDKYINDMQAPKSRQELIDLYGYDIRIADRPPEAPPRQLRRVKEPRKPHFQDFIPRMAVIDTTDGGQDSVPNLGDDEFIQYRKSASRNTRRNRMQNTDSRRGGRGGNRGNYSGGDVEAKNNRNRLDSNRTNQDGYRNVDVSAENTQAIDFPSLGESARHGVPKDVQGWKREDSEKMPSDTKPNSDRTQKLHTSENQNDSNYRNDNRDRFQQTQDIRKQEDITGKNRSQRNFKEDRREVYNQGRGRDGNFNSQAQGENWRSAQSDFRDGYNRGNDYNGSVRGGHQDFSYSRRKQQQQPVTGGNMGPRAGKSGDSGGYFGNNKRDNRVFDQPQHQQQQPEMVGPANKDAREYTNSSYKYPEAKSKPKNAHTSSAAPTSDISGGDDSVSSNSKSVVISNKENVQTINVTITSTTTEKKSYAKERRAKGVSRPMEGAVMVGSTDPQTTLVAPISSNPYQSLPPGVRMDLTSPPLSAGANPYSSLRQQGMFTEPPPVAGSGAKLYNPSLPPPSFYQREHGGLPPGQHPAHTPPGNIQDPAHFPPALLPPTTALPFGLPVSSAGLALPPNAAGIPTNPALFQPPAGPPPSNPIAAPATAMIAAPFLPAGMMFGAGARVPSPGAPAAFPLTLAYTAPPPQGTVAAAVVGNQPPLRVTAAAQSIQATAQHKKVYRGDITYYAPELQQPSRTPQKRPKAAIPIINPQEVSGQKSKEKSEQRYTPEKFNLPENKTVPDSNTGKLATAPVDSSTTIRSTLVTRAGVERLSGAVHELKAQFISSTLSQGVGVTTVTSSLPLHAAPMACTSDITDVASSQANFSPLVSHTGNMKSASSLESSESKKMAIKTELSPGGPPVNNSTSNMAPLNKDIDQSLCTVMQNFQVENSSSKVEVGTSSAGNFSLNQEVCEKSLANSSQS